MANPQAPGMSMSMVGTKPSFTDTKSQKSVEFGKKSGFAGNMGRSKKSTGMNKSKKSSHMGKSK